MKLGGGLVPPNRRPTADGFYPAEASDEGDRRDDATAE
jgi:hypothetical protein